MNQLGMFIAAMWTYPWVHSMLSMHDVLPTTLTVVRSTYDFKTLQILVHFEKTEKKNFVENGNKIIGTNDKTTDPHNVGKGKGKEKSKEIIQICAGTNISTILVSMSGYY